MILASCCVAEYMATSLAIALRAAPEAAIRLTHTDRTWNYILGEMTPALPRAAKSAKILLPPSFGVVVGELVSILQIPKVGTSHRASTI